MLDSLPKSYSLDSHLLCTVPTEQEMWRREVLSLTKKCAELSVDLKATPANAAAAPAPAPAPPRSPASAPPTSRTTTAVPMVYQFGTKPRLVFKRPPIRVSNLFSFNQQLIRHLHDGARRGS